MKRSLGSKTLVYPLPAFLIGTYDHTGKANIMTAAWGGICCSEPPMFTVSVRKERWTHKAILANGGFTVNIPSVALCAETDFAGIASGRDTDKFAELGLTPVKGGFVNAPYVRECPVVLELSLHSHLHLGSHTQFIGKIEDVKADENCLDEKGIPLLAKVDPLMYDGGARQYFQAGELKGSAFSCGKVFWKKTGE